MWDGLPGALARAYWQGYLTKPLHKLNNKDFLRIWGVGPAALKHIKAAKKWYRIRRVWDKVRLMS